MQVSNGSSLNLFMQANALNKGSQVASKTSSASSQTGPLNNDNENEKKVTSILNHSSLDDSDKRLLANALVPNMIAVATATGSFSSSTAEARGNFMERAYEYFSDLKEKYNCTDNYMPWVEGLDEYDPTIEETMRKELHEMLGADAEDGIVQRMIVSQSVENCRGWGAAVWE